MLDNINNLNIIFAYDAGDLTLEKEALLGFKETKKEDGFGKLISNLQLEFCLTNDNSNYETNSLIFHENKIERIVVDYLGFPATSYSLPLYNKTNVDVGLDYNLKVIKTLNNKLQVLLEINCLLSKDVIKVKEKDVLIIDLNDKDKPRYNAISSLTSASLLSRKHNKLEAKKINLRWLDAGYMLKPRRINLQKVDDVYKVTDDDALYLKEYLGSDYLKELATINKKIINDIKRNTANRGCDIAYIHSFKYRINEEADLFNILVEYICGKKRN